ncbi:isochorismatase family protein [Acidithiobacillus sp. AMEEHan]|uniref:isochorismatase family protein n=1 Tax=Acidithiobacillus sp. AMEEHan TaxID=2994951 RepID=UPI0027E4716F|nr:isochorismatase family protein [Acidithiobacillus sp. AMEEHan]
MRIRAARSLVLVIDLQDKLLAMLGGERKETLLYNVHRFLGSARALELPILLSAQYPKGLGAIDPSLQDFGTVFEKTEFSCYANPALRNALRSRVDRRQICLLGVESHICVLQTALDLQSQGWEVVIPIDAIGSRDPQQGEWALARLRQTGVTLSSTESIFYEWMEDAADPRFRELAPAWR